MSKIEMDIDFNIDPRTAYVSSRWEQIYDPTSGYCDAPVYYWLDPECKAPAVERFEFRQQYPGISDEEWDQLFDEAAKRYQEYQASLDLRTAHVSSRRELVYFGKGHKDLIMVDYWHDPSGHGPAIDDVELRKHHPEIGDADWKRLFDQATKRYHLAAAKRRYDDYLAGNCLEDEIPF